MDVAAAGATGLVNEFLAQGADLWVALPEQGVPRLDLLRHQAGCRAAGRAQSRRRALIIVGGASLSEPASHFLKPLVLVHTSGNCHKGGEWVQGSQRRPRALRPADQEHRASRGMFAAPAAAMRATCRTDTCSQSPKPSCSLTPNVSPPPPAPNVPPPRHTVHAFGCPF